MQTKYIYFILLYSENIGTGMYYDTVSESVKYSKDLIFSYCTVRPSPFRWLSMIN